MKKLVCILAIGALVLGFSSCKKEGQYMPKKKITQIVDNSVITVAGQSVTNTTKQNWVWGGSVLSNIDYFDNADNNVLSVFFNYDSDNRISEITTTSHESFKYTYEGKYLNKIEYYRNENFICTYVFSRDNKKIIEVILSNPTKSAITMDVNPFMFILPESAAKSIAKTSAKANDGTITFKITWDGKNVTEVSAEINGKTQSYKWSYDNKINPFAGLLIPAMYSYSEQLSQNNVIEEIENLGNGPKTTTYTYEYEGKYPVRRYYTETVNESTRNATRMYFYSK